MSEKSRNIRQRPDEHYPEPGIPAEDAWEAMRTLLDEKLPVRGQSRGGSLFMLAVAVLGGLAALLSVILVFRKPADNLPGNRAPEYADRQITGQPVAASPEPGATAPATPTGSHAPGALLSAAPPKESSAPALPGARPVRRPGGPPNENPDAPVRSSRFTVRHSGSPRTAAPHGQSGYRLAGPAVSPDEDTNTDLVPSRTSPADDSRNLFSPAEPVRSRTGDPAGISIPARPASRLPLIERRQARSLSPDLELPVPRMSVRSAENTSGGQPQKSSFYPSISWELQWTGNFLMRNTDTYFGDLKEKRGAYLLLIPGLRAAKPLGEKQELSVFIRPYFDHFGGNSIVERKNEADSLAGSRNDGSPFGEIRVRKLRSSSIALAYHYRIGKHLQAGAGIGYHQHWNALGTAADTIRTGAADSLRWFHQDKELWQLLRNRNFTLNLEAVYRSRRVAAGIGLTAPVFPFGTTPYGAKPVNGQLFIRWKVGK